MKNKIIIGLITLSVFGGGSAVAYNSYSSSKQEVKQEVVKVEETKPIETQKQENKEEVKEEKAKPNVEEQKTEEQKTEEQKQAQTEQKEQKVSKQQVSKPQPIAKVEQPQPVQKQPTYEESRAKEKEQAQKDYEESLKKPKVYTIAQQQRMAVLKETDGCSDMGFVSDINSEFYHKISNCGGNKYTIQKNVGCMKNPKPCTNCWGEWAKKYQNY